MSTSTKQEAAATQKVVQQTVGDAFRQFAMDMLPVARKPIYPAVDRIPGLQFEPDKLSEKDAKLLQVSRKLDTYNFVQQREPNRIVVLVDGEQERVFDRLYATLSSEEQQLVAKQRGRVLDAPPISLPALALIPAAVTPPAATPAAVTPAAATPAAATPTPSTAATATDSAASCRIA